MQEEALNLRDLILILKRHSCNLFITPVAFALVAFLVATFLVTPKYQASGVIQIGQVNQVPLESALNLESRMHDESFVPTVADSHQAIFLNGSSDAAVLRDEVAKLKRDLVVKKIKDTELVSFSLTSKDQALASGKASAIVDSLKKAHTALFETGVNSIKRQLELTQHQIDLVQHDMDNLANTHRHSRVVNAYNAVLDALVVQDRSNQMRTLIQHKFDLETSLNPAITFNTKLLGQVYVSDGPVSPNVPLITLIALLLGFFLAVVVAFVHNALTDNPLQA